ncbi:hypothetical protein C8J56DRAFT_935192 [Mycena floridula]|nr:hypothetical protein C8J56DRAFT_935192 [Mycena floridula]
MSFNLLPAELLDAIAFFTPSRDLVAFSLLSSTTRPVAQRHLYRHVALSSELKNLSVLITLARKPAIAHVVRSFSITLSPQSTLFRAFYLLLATALSSMTELVALEVSVPEQASWILSGTGVHALPRLKHFATGFSFDSHVARFIERSELIVPGRPVESILLNSGDATDSTVDALDASTASLAVLGASTSSPELFLDHLTNTRMAGNLVYLRVMTTYDFSALPDIRSFYANVARALAGLPSLQGFELSGVPWGSHEDNKRVWQSEPLTYPDNQDIIDVSSDFFQY